jgi:hypothetical protein
MKKICLFISLITLVSCDREKDTPEPSNFKNLALKKLNVQFDLSTGTVFNLADSNLFTQAVLLRVGNPLFGRITKGSDAGQYVYKADRKSVLIDSAEYQICEGNNCKSAWIIFKVSPGSCLMEPHSDKFTYNLEDTLFLPIISNDTSYCPDAQVSKLENLPVGHGFVHNNKAALILPTFFKGNVSFTYDITNGHQTKTTPVELTVQLDQTYCDAHFKLTPDTIRQGYNPSITLSLESLLANDFFAIDFVNLQTFELIEDSQNSYFTVTKYGNEIRINPLGASGSGSFYYKLCTSSGKCETAKVLLKIQ